MATLTLNGVDRQFEDDGSTLLEVLREQLGCRSAKDGCSPQGQCGCCTVWIDGAPRVSCVTPARRAAGRDITTTEGLPEDRRRRWAGAFTRAGASQCGFCTPGILLRLAALEGRPDVDVTAVRTALLPHVCRCTGWQTVVEAAVEVLGLAPAETASSRAPARATRDPLLAAWRAQLEGPSFQSSGPEVALGGGGFADDTAPADALVALPAAGDPDRGRGSDDPSAYVVAESLTAAHRQTGKVQGRRSTAPLHHPLEVPDGDWALTLRTTWVEPAYLEPDASWCRPGGQPVTPLANGGAFGGKRRSPVERLARQLADDRGLPVRVRWPREAVVRWGPKRPPVALGMALDGSGVLRVGRTPGSADLSPLVDRVAAAAPALRTELVDVAGPPTAPELRGAGWVEAAVGLAAVSALTTRTAPDPNGSGTEIGTELGTVTGTGTGTGIGAGAGTPATVIAPSGACARARVSPDLVEVDLWAGEILDEVTLRSYCIGAVHQALGWVWSEGIAVDGSGAVLDLTMRSFGVLTARDTPRVQVTIHPSDRWPVNGADAVFAATAAAAWLAEGLPPTWPTRRAGS